MRLVPEAAAAREGNDGEQREEPDRDEGEPHAAAGWWLEGLHAGS